MILVARLCRLSTCDGGRGPNFTGITNMRSDLCEVEQFSDRGIEVHQFFMWKQ